MEEKMDDPGGNEMDRIDANLENKAATTGNETMEVHHHPDIHHKRKKFREYFLEFLMIFLAVTMGFLAESLREHINDKAKGKEYMSSLVAELRYDTAEYNKVLNEILYIRPILDSLFINVREASRFNYVLMGKWNTPVNEMHLLYMPTLPTIQQLKSSGNLRLIQSKAVSTKMMEYETFVQGSMHSEEQSITGAMEKIFSMEDELCDESEFNEKTDKNMEDSAAQYSMKNGFYYNMRLMVKDPVTLNKMANGFINYKSRNWGYYTNTMHAKAIATELIKSIGEAYHLEHE